MRRLIIHRINQIIQDLESTERVNGKSERYKQFAISYLQNYRVELECKGKKSVKIKDM